MAGIGAFLLGGFSRDTAAGRQSTRHRRSVAPAALPNPDRQLSLRSTHRLSASDALEWWNDILLEQWSDEARRKPGRVQKPLACDFIAYAYAQSGVCYLLPVAPLQRAWQQQG